MREQRRHGSSCSFEEGIEQRGRHVAVEPLAGPARQGVGALRRGVGADRPVNSDLFAGAAHEREGSEIARQIVRVLQERRVKVCFVTPLHEFAHGLHAGPTGDAIFLRAERRADGARTFRQVEDEPVETSRGEDPYRRIFGVGTKEDGGA
jgi:hypothetical protein